MGKDIRDYSVIDPMHVSPGTREGAWIRGYTKGLSDGSRKGKRMLKIAKRVILVAIAIITMVIVWKS